MAIIKCKMCGGEVELAADKTFGTCEFCGNTMTFPKVDDEQRAAAFNRGNHFRRIGEFDKALAVYERIVREDDTDAEAHWCCALCRFGIEYVEDPATYEWLPTCHRASFDSFLEDVDYLAAVENSEGITKRQYQKDAAKIAEVQRGILATSQNEEPFDVFLCYKETDENGQRTRDSLMAQDVYYQLTDQGYRVFFARITLEDVVGKQYEPYIFAALNSAKVMIVIGSKPEYMNAVWVKNEWSRFLAMMKKDRNKLLLPCYRDMDPYDMPEQLSVLQSYDMSKIGFIQDLIRGIKKVLNADKKPEPVHEPLVVPQTNSNVVALLKRGNMALEDREWDKADQFFEEVLNQDAECVEAYLGKALADLHLQQAGMLAESPQAFSRNLHFQKALRFAKGPQLQTLKDHAAKNQAFLLERGKALLESEQWETADRFFDQALVNDPECVEAYLGKAMSQLHVKRIEQIPQCYHPIADNPHYQKALLIAKNEQLQALKDYIPQQQAFLLKQGTACLNEGNWNKAKTLFKITLDRKPGCTESLIGMGLANHEHHSITALAEAHIKMTERVPEKNLSIDSAFKPTTQAQQKVLDRLQQSDAHIRQMVHQYGVPPLYNEIHIRNAYQSLTTITVVSAVAARQTELMDEKAFWSNDPYFGHVLKASSEQGTNPVKEAMDQVLGVMQQRLDEAKENERTALENIMADFDDRLQAIDRKVMDESKEARQRWEEEEQRIADKRRKAALITGRIYVSPNGKLPLHVSLSSTGFVQVSGTDQYRDDIKTWTQMASVSLGEFHALGLTAFGTARATGSNQYKQCDVSGWNNLIAVAAGGWFSLGLKKDGSVCATGSNDCDQCNVSSWNNIIKIAAGRQHAVGLMSNGRVVATGLKDDGRCNVSDWRDIVDIWAYNYYTVGLRADGTVVTTNPQINTSSWRNIVTVATAYECLVGLTKNGDVKYTGKNLRGAKKATEWSNIVDISMQNCHCVGLKLDGTVVAAGLNDSGQCDVGKWQDIVAVSAGTFSTLGIRSNGTVMRAGGSNAQPYSNAGGWKLFGSIDTLENELQEQQKKWETIAHRRAQTICQHCGGTFKKVLFATKCTACGMPKDY